MAKAQIYSRRSFLRRGVALGAAGVVGPYIIPSGVLAAEGRPGANDRVRVGYIGIGRRGQQLMPLPAEGEIVAISDLNAPRMDELAGRSPEGARWKKYKDYRRLLEDRDVDAVIVATPDHWHALCSIHACQAGKDVYCEKPLTLTVREGRAMVEAARANKRVFQTGSQQRSDPGFRKGCELIRNGRLGKIQVIHTDLFPSPWECKLGEEPVPEGLDWDMWCGQTELRPFHSELYAPRVRDHEAGWISFRPYSGGEMTGWGAHGFDIIQWALGTDLGGPTEVWPLPGTERPERASFFGPRCEVVFRYENGIEVHCDDQGPGASGVFVGANGKIVMERGKLVVEPEALGNEPLPGNAVRLYASDDHMKNWIACIKSREMPIADVEIGHRTATMCHLGNIARWTNRKLKWDPKTETFPGDEEANSYLQRPMRAPHTI